MENFENNIYNMTHYPEIMDRLEKKLMEGYYQQVTPELQQMAVDYVIQTPSVHERSFKFISKLVRLIDYIVRKKPEVFRGHLDTVLTYNAEGLEKLSLGHANGSYTPEERESLEAAFHHNMGVITRKMYYYNEFAGRNKQEILIEWYGHMRAAADMISQHMTKRKAAAYGLAGDAAYLLFQSLGGEWREIALECYQLFLEYHEKEPDPGLNRVAQLIKRKIAQLSASEKPAK